MMKGIFADSINKCLLSTLVSVTRHELSWCYRTQVCVPNTQRDQAIHQSLEQRKVYCRAMQGDEWFMP